jgi:hypothetical protein
MVPPALAAETFRLFMAIPPERIERDAAGSLLDYEAARLRTVAFYRTAEEDMTPGQCAEHLHAKMVMGCIALAHPGVIPAAVAFHLAGVGAREATEAAAFAARQKGELGRLDVELDRIIAAAGIKDLHEAGDDDLPPEYHPLAERAGEISLNAQAAVMVTVLNRYGLRDLAGLFEADEAAFDARVREGYFVLFPDQRRPD